MSFSCYGCRRHFESFRTLISHMRKDCNPLKGTSTYYCGQQLCGRHFAVASSLKKHLLRCHSSDIVAGSHNSPSCPSHPHNDSVPTTSAEKRVSLSSSVPTLELQIATTLATLYGKGVVPRNVVQYLFNEVRNILRTSQTVILQGIKQSLISQGLPLPTNIENVLTNILQEVSKTGSNLTSEYKRFQYFQNLGTLIMPIQVCIGERLEQRHVKNELTLVHRECTLQVIPMGDVLKNFLSLPGVLKDVLSYIKNFDENKEGINNIMQGTLWRKFISQMKQEVGVLHLPLVLYFDDFETGNPLGSHCTVHKLAGVYISLPFLPLQYFSQLRNIFILSLFHSADRLTYGNRMIFQRILDELNVLSREGINVNNDVFVGTIKFHVASLSADNLGLNQLLGFVQSFVANYFCRICHASRKQIRSMVYEDDTLFRTQENYEHDVQIQNPSLTGIKEECFFLKYLDGFTLQHASVDILHDFLEGACRYVFSYIIRFLLQESNLITLNLFQSKLSNFDYGPDSNCKPINCIILEGNNLKIKTSAAEMCVLTRYFGVLLGSYIPEGHEVWELFLYLRRILDRLLNQTVTPHSAQQLQFWVVGLNELYLKLTKSDLKPKFHFLLHYHQMLLRFGPLTQVWTMRFEAKHRVSKFIARSTATTVNICRTIMVKNQLLLNEIFFKNEPLSRFSCGKKTKISKDCFEYVRLKRTCNVKGSLFSVRWIKINGTELCISSILTLDLNVDTFLPIFGEVKKIYIDCNDKVFLSCTMFETIDFDLHYFAYHVSPCTEGMDVEFDKLLTCIPNTLTILPNLERLITLRMPID